MEWIREHIGKMPSFGYLNTHISTIEETIEMNPALCIELCKSLMESICKTILNNQNVAFEESNNIQALAKQTMRYLLPNEHYRDKMDELIRRLASVVQVLGEMRNISGFASHGQDVLHVPIGKSASLLAYKATDIVGGFILYCYINYSTKPNTRIHYEDCQSFNETFDEENPLELGGVILSASEALYKQDYEAYKEAYYSYLDNLKVIRHGIYRR